MTKRFFPLFLLPVLSLSFESSAAALDVASWDDLNTAIGSSNVSSTSTTIQFTGNIAAPGTFLTPLCIDSPSSSFSLLDGCDVTIDGNGFALQPGSSYPGFFVSGNPYDTLGVLTNTSSVILQNLTIEQAAAHGGNSGRGGGGAGLGGGLFVGTNASVTLIDVVFTNCSATGGSASGNAATRGGGGMGGAGGFGSGGGFSTAGALFDGGATTFAANAGGIGMGAGGGPNGGAVGTLGSNNGEVGTQYNSGGGGGYSAAGNGGNGTGGGFGAVALVGGTAGLGGGAGGNGRSSGGTTGGGGGGGGYVGGGGAGGADVGGTGTGGGGGGFGGGGGEGNTAGGGGGGFGGGGGLGNIGGGGGGGFGGGGGQGNGNNVVTGGNGGFGGGGGNSNAGAFGVSLFGGGSGQTGNPFKGGGGMGAGGAIFVHTGGTLNIESASFSGSAVTGGTGANSGSAYGEDIFLMSGGNINFNLTSDLSVAAIGGNYSQGGFVSSESSGITINNEPGVTLTFATPIGQASYNGLFDGVLNINGGVLSVDSDYGLGYSTVDPSLNGGTLVTTSNLTTTRDFSLGDLGGTLEPAVGTTLSISGVVSGDDGVLIKDGAGTLALSNTNTYNGGTTLNAGTLSIASEDNIGGSDTNLTLSGGTLLTTGDLTLAGDTSVTANSTINSGDGFTTSLTGTMTGTDGTTLTLAGAGVNSIAGGIVVNDTDTFTIDGDVGGADALTKTGAGTLALNVINPYTRGIVVSEGTLDIVGDITIPAAPTDAVAVADEATVNLDWTNPPNSRFDSVTIRMSTTDYPSSASDGTLLAENVATDSYTAEFAENGTYYFSIFSKDDVGDFSTPATASVSVDVVVPETPPEETPETPPETAPAAPTNVAATVDGQTIALTWTNPSDDDFDSVTIRMSTTDYPASVTDGDLLVEDATAGSYSSSNFTPGTTYYFSLFSKDTEDNFSPAATASVNIDEVTVNGDSVFGCSLNPHVTKNKKELRTSP